MEFLELKSLDKAYLESMGFSWHTDEDKSDYLDNQALVISKQEAENYYLAANELYDMFINAAEEVIKNNRFDELGIAFNLVDVIKASWENEVHWHLYGRFDFAGGLDSKPIKLLEFNADTPTSLFESAILQWLLLKQNKLDETLQFNNIYEALRDNFKRLVMLDNDLSLFDKHYKGWKILFSSLANKEDEITTKLLAHIAKDAGFHTNFAYIDEVEFSPEGVFYNNENYEYFFKLIPWEDIAIDEGELALLLSSIIQNQNAIILNPAYTLLFQSKGILKILCELYENHPLLLDTKDYAFGSNYVEKPVFGREGSNIKIVKNNQILQENKGPYANNKKIYQEYYELNSYKQNYYQAGVFFAYEACGLGFRKGNHIMDNMSKFVSHIIKA